MRFTKVIKKLLCLAREVVIRTCELIEPDGGQRPIQGDRMTLRGELTR